MSPRHPWLLHLPRRAMLAGTTVARLARAAGDLRDLRELERRFGLRSHEHRLVAEVVRRSPQLWVFRCDQLRSCGDIVVVDMSAPRAIRRAAVIELKQRTVLRTSRHRQLENHAVVVAELVHRRVLEPSAEVSLLYGTAAPDELARRAIATPRVTATA